MITFSPADNLQFCLGNFTETYNPTIEDTLGCSIVVDNVLCNLEVLDPSGLDDYTFNHEAWITSSDAFLMVYSVTSRFSFQNIEANWYRKITSYSQNWLRLPIALVGTKCDLRKDREVNILDGVALAQKLGVQFFESSAKNNTDVQIPVLTLVRELIGSERGSRKDAVEAG
jgi:GTPase KRas